eukprot:c21585_g1_i1.p1 GENE.c21585_g1_i1~~c21585_g1_i1.p1  ORF type:complete len:389 (+),score=96.79 c21585_g1_i1:99-1169(+)
MVEDPYLTLMHPRRSRGLLGWHDQHCALPRVMVPTTDDLVYDSGKLKALDELLKQLKAGGHRVLLYSQMTKMLDIIEDFMIGRRYTYCRLDGSSSIAVRNDTVRDFQSSDRVFVFLLSTRAGGVGINLTAADTVVFYDIDWNPTMDAQAMDRTHRIGQTKQVTVYRLMIKGSIEEKILNRAKTKDRIQQTVYSGKFGLNDWKNQEMLSLLIDEEDAEDGLKRLAEKGSLAADSSEVMGMEGITQDSDSDEYTTSHSKRSSDAPPVTRGVKRPRLMIHDDDPPEAPQRHQSGSSGSDVSNNNNAAKAGGAQAALFTQSANITAQVNNLLGKLGNISATPPVLSQNDSNSVPTYQNKM